MKEARLLKRIQERKFSAHHMLIRAAERAQEAVEKRVPGSFYDELVTMTFAALAIEALANSIGERVVPEWNDYESASPIAKLRILAERLGVPYKKDAEPWATAIWLVKFRNLVAHAKPELIVEEKLITEEEHAKKHHDRPESKLEKLITNGNAARALRGAEQIKDTLINKIAPEDALGLYADGWFGSTTRHEG